VLDVDAQDSFEMAATDDQEVVEALRSDGADEAVGVGVRPRRANGRVDDSAEHLVERGAELAVAVVDQEAHPREQAGEAEVARLPVRLVVQPARWTRRLPSSTEEEHVQATQRECLDGEEVAGEHARRLLAKEHRPAPLSAPRRGLEPGGGKQTPDRARGETMTKFHQFTGHPLIAPAWVLSREPHH
jgi:hypothetical protein